MPDLRDGTNVAPFGNGPNFLILPRSFPEARDYRYLGWFYENLGPDLFTAVLVIKKQVQHSLIRGIDTMDEDEVCHHFEDIRRNISSFIYSEIKRTMQFTLTQFPHQRVANSFRFQMQAISLQDHQYVAFASSSSKRDISVGCAQFLASRCLGESREEEIFHISGGQLDLTRGRWSRDWDYITIRINNFYMNRAAVPRFITHIHTDDNFINLLENLNRGSFRYGLKIWSHTYLVLQNDIDEVRHIRKSDINNLGRGGAVINDVSDDEDLILEDDEILDFDSVFNQVVRPKTPEFTAEDLLLIDDFLNSGIPVATSDRLKSTIASVEETINSVLLDDQRTLFLPQKELKIIKKAKISLHLRKADDLRFHEVFNAEKQSDGQSCKRSENEISCNSLKLFRLGQQAFANLSEKKRLKFLNLVPNQFCQVKMTTEEQRMNMDKIKVCKYILNLARNQSSDCSRWVGRFNNLSKYFGPTEEIRSRNHRYIQLISQFITAASLQKMRCDEELLKKLLVGAQILKQHRRVVKWARIPSVCQKRYGQGFRFETPNVDDDAVLEDDEEIPEYVERQDHDESSSDASTSSSTSASESSTSTDDSDEEEAGPSQRKRTRVSDDTEETSKAVASITNLSDSSASGSDDDSRDSYSTSTSMEEELNAGDSDSEDGTGAESQSEAVDVDGKGGSSEDETDGSVHTSDEEFIDDENTDSD